MKEYCCRGWRSFLGCTVVIGAGHFACAETRTETVQSPHQRVDTEGTSPPAVATPAGEAGASLAGVDAWIAEILLAEEDYASRDVVRYYELSEIAIETMAWRQSYGREFRPRCRGITEPEVELFIRVGPPAIPRLMAHVRDCRKTRWDFHYPLSSHVDLNPDFMSVGKVACYMIEAILRENAYFTSSAVWCYTASPRGGEPSDECAELALAAEAYESWFQRCYDAEHSEIICGADDLPVILWDYDLNGWSRYVKNRNGH